MALLESEIELLATLIKKEIQEEFSNKKITGNLANTITIEKNSKNEYNIIIPAEKYDLKEWDKHKVIKKDPIKSYANAVNETGGFSKTHKGYVERAIEKAVVKWMSLTHKHLAGYGER